MLNMRMLILRRMVKMRLFVSLIATAVFFVASAASAQITWSVNAFTSDGSALSAVTPGATITLDITLRNSGSVNGIGGAAFGYETGVVSLGAGSLLSAHVLAGFATGPGTGFGGLDNLVASAVQTSGPAPLRGEVQFMNGLSLSTTGIALTGTADIGIAAPNAVGGAQFRLVMNAVGAGTTTVTVGTSEAYGDAIVLPGGAFGTSDNAAVNITVIPEPGTALLMGLGLAGLAAAGRRE
jgi:hypothetical protein